MSSTLATPRLESAHHESFVARDESDRGKELLMWTLMGRFGKTVELVGSAIFLASDASAFVTGEILVVDGGFFSQRCK